MPLKAKRLVLDWRKRQQTRAIVQVAIEEALDKVGRLFGKSFVETFSRGC